MHCTNCGCELTDGASICPECGESTENNSVVITDAAQIEATAQDMPEAVNEDNGEKNDPLIGWSDKLDDPDIKKAADKHKKAAHMFGIIFGILFPVGFAIAGILIKAIPIDVALIVGFALGVLMAALAFFRSLSLNRPIWEGTVADKTAVEHYDKKNSEKANTVYTVVFHGIGGGRKKLRIKNNSEFYDYYKVGDKVRYYPVFGTFEKRDKSQDSIIFCNVCSAQNPIGSKKCSRCKSPLFK